MPLAARRRGRKTKGNNHSAGKILFKKALDTSRQYARPDSRCSGVAAWRRKQRGGGSRSATTETRHEGFAKGSSCDEGAEDQYDTTWAQGTC